MSKSFQNEVPPSRINIKLDLHTGGAQKKVELPLKLLVTGDYSNGQDKRDLAEKEKVNINKNNFDSVLSDFNPKANLTVKNTLSPAGGEMNVNLDFKSMRDFHPEQIAQNVPELRALLAMRNLLRDLNPTCWTTLLSVENWKPFCVTKTCLPNCATVLKNRTYQ